MLMGGPGEDTLTGGLGTDIFICGSATDTVTDFNVTQKDTNPENDCENIKNVSGSNAENNETLSIQQQQDSNLGNTNIEPITGNTTQKTDEQKPDNGLFFGLFK
jgi:Ca2+-binding RTX toxin-like protein